ncbi:uncharacterized protein LOC122792417 [Protopterus annectens]|uniref:uncharacterized protein LOC122792417 n=1 Tax=Protopterus annectens TaxID=7888 RepID=UPI001CFBCBA5|nr:uncharacterized protein LOC122792417 [Protopterus annectens]
MKNNKLQQRTKMNLICSQLPGAVDYFEEESDKEEMFSGGGYETSNKLAEKRAEIKDATEDSRQVKKLNDCCNEMMLATEPSTSASFPDTSGGGLPRQEATVAPEADKKNDHPQSGHMMESVRSEKPKAKLGEPVKKRKKKTDVYPESSHITETLTSKISQTKVERSTKVKLACTDTVEHTNHINEMEKTEVKPEVQSDDDDLCLVGIENECS